MKKSLAISLFVLVCLPVFVEAGPIIRSGESVSIDADQVLKGDFYAGGASVSISGRAENDVYLAGGTVTVNAPVAEDLVVLGGVVQVHGEVTDDIRVAGGGGNYSRSGKG